LLVTLFSKFRQIWHAKIERRLFSATICAIFILKVACSPSDIRGLHATFGKKIAPVVAENKRRSIWGWSIQAKRTVISNSGKKYDVTHACASGA
jgi:hypothetical protein